MFFIRQYVAVHVNDFSRKHDVLVLMARKLCTFAQGGCCEDNIDSISYQELLLPGHLLCSLIKEKLEDSLGQATSHMRRDARAGDKEGIITKIQKQGILPYCGRIFHRYFGTVGAKIASFIASGNLISSSGLDLQQTTGFAIVAERLNKWRHLSHFRSVHRGQFFTTMKTTIVRKLLPEAWGFLCPVHTPDGSPCGLLSHLAAKAHVVCAVANTALVFHWRVKLINALISLGMVPVDSSLNSMRSDSKIRSREESERFQECWSEVLHICLDGVVLGSASDQVCTNISSVLRRLKVKAFSCLGIDRTIEIAHFNRQGLEALSPFAGLYLFSQPARLVRPVLQCGLSPRIELIGPLEQSTLQISCNTHGSALAPDNITFSLTGTHAEIDPTSMLSILASLTPFSDFNQSPRNMYQCQMGKQTMGTPVHSLSHRGDSKLYRILHPQSPLVCTRDFQSLQLDLYAQGTNAVVAVISYTGYDMEDAMIINRSTYERGFCHGVVYKSMLIDLTLEAERRNKDASGKSAGNFKFGKKKDDLKKMEGNAGLEANSTAPYISEDGLPAVGQKICPGEPIWCAYSEDSDECMSGTHKDSEFAYVDAVRFIGYIPVSSPLSSIVGHASKNIVGVVKEGEKSSDTRPVLLCAFLVTLLLEISFHHDMVRKVSCQFYGLNVTCLSVRLG